MKYHKIPDETIRRLSVCLRTLILPDQRCAHAVSSTDMAGSAHLKTPVQPKDFHYFDAFSVKGIRYNVDTLIGRICRTLKLDDAARAVLVGLSRLGKALMSCPRCRLCQSEIVTVLGNTCPLVGKRIGPLAVGSLAKIVRIESLRVRLALLTVPASLANKVARQLVEAARCGILNLATCYLTVPKRVGVRTIDIAMELGTLPYYV